MKIKTILPLSIFIISMMVIIGSGFIYAIPAHAAWQQYCASTFTYTGVWSSTAYNKCDNLYYSSATGSTFTISALTTRFRMVGRTLTNGGVLDVILDGKLLAKVSTWNSSAFEGVLFDSGDLPYGLHTVVGIVEAQSLYYSVTPTAGQIQVIYLNYLDDTPTPTITLAPTYTPNPVPTLYFSPTISYGDYALSIPLICLVMLAIVGFIAWLVIEILWKKRG